METVKRQVHKRYKKRVRRPPQKKKHPVSRKSSEEKYRALYMEQKRMQRILTRNKLCVLVLLLTMTLIHIFNYILYPSFLIFPEHFILGFFLVGTTFLWLQEMRDNDILQNIVKALNKKSALK